ncbi:MULTISPECIES: exonuclease SbcCD subunit D [Cryobacterium]|uniref:exonuclease SbcCD subunit D n=1 Tax=Cryobacterium TaxID=69578 RepID=UPI000CD4425E|nr:MULTISPECIES: exonuclease SbcCD subunit D [Cryobacterium]POH69671.1 exonuclease sbcCD subunit D [Cryobacterium zongtaii]TFC48856.1 exonuclease SbcCD subunit D [Cryobacterium sp. TMN-39-2]
MKILHTSDWHIGRTFHTHSTLDHLALVLDALVDIVRERGVDVVAVAGDIFDSATPSADSYTLLSGTLARLHATGARVVMTSGNHDSATRLGFQSEWAGLAGIHVVTGFDQYRTPISIDDEHGPVHFYGIPFLEPALVRHHYPDELLKTHEQVLGLAMRQVRADLADRGGRSVVLAHCFAAGVAASDVERDISAGGLDLVPVSVFDGPDYVALGHIHGRAQITDRVRYSGAPLHYSFAEADKPRGGWLVDLDANGLAETEWVDLPIPRRLRVVTGELESLAHDDAFTSFENDWIAAVLTDRVRPLDGMRTLQKRFPHCVALEHRPTITQATEESTYSDRVKHKSDPEIVAGFLEFVRNGVGLSAFERELVAEVLGDTTEATV